jgi:hypothetical protein
MSAVNVDVEPDIDLAARPLPDPAAATCDPEMKACVSHSNPWEGSDKKGEIEVIGAFGRKAETAPVRRAPAVPTPWTGV